MKIADRSPELPEQLKTVRCDRTTEKDGWPKFGRTKLAQRITKLAREVV